MSPHVLSVLQEQVLIWVTGMVGVILTSFVGWLTFNAKLLVRAIRAWVVDRESQSYERDNFFIDAAYATAAEVAAEAVANQELSIDQAIDRVVDRVNGSVATIIAKLGLTPEVLRDKAAARLYVAMRLRGFALHRGDSK